MWAELITGGGILTQFLLLLLFPQSGGRRFQQGAFFATMLFAILACFAQALGWLPVLELYPSFLAPNPLSAFPLAAVLVSLAGLAFWMLRAEQIHVSRRSEVLLLFTFLSLFLGLLFASLHILVSILLLISISWTGLFLTGLSFRNRKEGEGLVKFWAQLGFGLGTGLALSAITIFLAGGGSWEKISSVGALGGGGGVVYGLLMGAIYLPYFVAAGAFPFHLASTDRDEGAPWIVQVALSVIVQGAVMYGAWLVSVRLFHGEGGVALGMRILQWAALAGAFWHFSVGIYHANSQRIFSCLSGGVICLMVSAAALPTPHSAAALSFATAVNLLWLTLLGLVWGRVQERSGGGGIESVRGEARRSRWDALSLVLALSVPLGLPFLPGFSLSTMQIGSLLEQRSMMFLGLHFFLLLLQLVFCIRIITELLFGEKEEAGLRSLRPAKPSWIECGGMALVGTALLLPGLASSMVFDLLHRAAIVFLK